MLYSFTRYTRTSRLNTLLCINKVTSLQRSVKLAPQRAKIFYPSIFLRKSYFRTLLLHLNQLYATLDTPGDNNYFYPYKFMVVYYNNSHPSFYFRKLAVK